MLLQGYSLPSQSSISIFDQMKNPRILGSNHLSYWGGILSTAMMPKGGAKVKALDRVQCITKDEILKGCQ